MVWVKMNFFLAEINSNYSSSRHVAENSVPKQKAGGGSGEPFDTFLSMSVCLHNICKNWKRNMKLLIGGNTQITFRAKSFKRILHQAFHFCERIFALRVYLIVL